MNHRLLRPFFPFFFVVFNGCMPATARLNMAIFVHRGLKKGLSLLASISKCLGVVEGMVADEDVVTIYHTEIVST